MRCSVWGVVTGAAALDAAVLERKKKLETSQNQLVEMRPEFAEALKRCNTFACKGHSRQPML